MKKMVEIAFFTWTDITTLLRSSQKQEWTAKEKIINPGRGTKCTHYEV